MRWCSASGPIGSNSSSGPSVTERQPARAPIEWARRVVGLMAFALVLSGCPLQWQRIAINETIKPEDVTFIRAGKTTLFEVVAEFSAPVDITQTLCGAGGMQ